MLIPGRKTATGFNIFIRKKGNFVVPAALKDMNLFFISYAIKIDQWLDLF
jgi:hypothetical protein